MLSLLADRTRRDTAKMKDRFLRDPLGFLMVVLGTFILGYGGVGLLNTPFRIKFFEAWAGAIFSGIEIIILLLPCLAIIRRIVSNDFYLSPSRMTGPVVALAFYMAIIPYFRMVIEEGTFRIPMEANFVPFFIIMFFAWRLIFHPSDIRLMVWILLICIGYRCVEGIAIWFSNDIIWGLLTGWRDGLFLSMGLSGALFAYVIKPEGEVWYARMRKMLFIMAPVVIFIFIASMRRSYMVGLVVAIPVLLFYLRPAERKRLLTIIVLALPIFIAATFVVGADRFTERVGGIATPGQESSAAWRIIEYYNVYRMALDRPLFGWPWGAAFINYTGIELTWLNILVPHNVYLYVVMRSGLVGLAFFLWFVWRYIRLSIDVVKGALSPGYRFIALWMASATLIFFFAGITNPVFASKLIILVPFLMTLTSFLPGALKKNAVGTKNSLVLQSRSG
ncbi:MAG: O-antigen ligase family protein [Candidatus Kapaibacterium sp.]